MSSIEQKLRTRLDTFLTAVNAINALGFEEVYPQPPATFPTARSLVVEIESEDVQDEGTEAHAHTSRRQFNVKIACVWGEVDPGDQALGIEDKVIIIRDAIEQSSWLLDEDNSQRPEFTEIFVTGIDKRYNPVGYMESGIISVQFICFETWSRDNTYAEISKPDITTTDGTAGYAMAVNWTIVNSAGITGYKVYIRTINNKPTTATATLGAAVRTYTFTGLTPSTTYYIWVDSYNTMMEKSSSVTAATGADPNP